MRWEGGEEEVVVVVVRVVVWLVVGVVVALVGVVASMRHRQLPGRPPLSRQWRSAADCCRPPRHPAAVRHCRHRWRVVWSVGEVRKWRWMRCESEGEGAQRTWLEEVDGVKRMSEWAVTVRSLDVVEVKREEGGSEMSALLALQRRNCESKPWWV